MLPKRTLVAGVKIRGYGIPNEYGEFTFIPEETGAHAGRQKIVFQDGGTTVKETKEHLLLSFKVKKGKAWTETVPQIYNAVNAAVTRLKNYEV